MYHVSHSAEGKEHDLSFLKTTLPVCVCACAHRRLRVQFVRRGQLLDSPRCVALFSVFFFSRSLPHISCEFGICSFTHLSPSLPPPLSSLSLPLSLSLSVQREIEYGREIGREILCVYMPLLSLLLYV